MAFTHWMIIIGLLLVAMALAGSVLKRLPLSASMLYLLVGFAIGPAGLNLLKPEPFEYARLLERAAEIVVLVSLFSCGLKLKLPLSDSRWRLSFRLAVVSMVITIALIALAAALGMALPLGAALLLGAILAPTDPVLAADVQVHEPGDRDRLRFSLTSEAGLNDGAAFPFVMLGLALLGFHEIGVGGWRWLIVDLIWAVGGGLALGSILGWLVGRLILYLRINHREALGLDEFLTLGLIALAYGVALLLHAYGFLAVFAAGLALQRVASRPDPAASGARPERVASPVDEPARNDLASHPVHAPAHMTREVLSFNEQLERIGEIALVLVLGAMLWYVRPSAESLWFVPLLLFMIRPVSAWCGLLRSRTSGPQRLLISWFGIRGVGSIYYLFYSINHGLPRELGEQFLALTLTAVACSIVLHGVSVTPLMRRYAKSGGAAAM